MTKMSNINLRISQDILDIYAKKAKQRSKELGKRISVQEMLRECLIQSVNEVEKPDKAEFHEELMEKIYILSKMNSELLKTYDKSENFIKTKKALAIGIEFFNKIKSKYKL